MNPLQRVVAWLASVTLAQPCRPNGGIDAPVYQQGTADKGWGELHQEIYDAHEAWRQNPLARRLVGNGITLRSEYKPLQRCQWEIFAPQPILTITL